MNGEPLSLIETMRFQPGQGFLNIALHRSRMKRSAEALGLPFADEALDAALASVPSGEGLRRVRLELFADGHIEAVHSPYIPLPENRTWRIAIAALRLSSSDPLLRHKTSRRNAYDQARAEYPAQAADEVLLLNEAGEVCEGTITSIFLTGPDGILLTPPLASGLLAGVLREKLLIEGKAREAVLTVDDLRTRTFYMGNSLRGLIPARLS